MFHDLLGQCDEVGRIAVGALYHVQHKDGADDKPLGGHEGRRRVEADARGAIHKRIVHEAGVLQRVQHDGGVGAHSVAEADGARDLRESKSHTGFEPLPSVVHEAHCGDGARIRDDRVAADGVEELVRLCVQDIVTAQYVHSLLVVLVGPIEFSYVVAAADARQLSRRKERECSGPFWQRPVRRLPLRLLPRIVHAVRGFVEVVEDSGSQEDQGGHVAYVVVQVCAVVEATHGPDDVASRSRDRGGRVEPDVGLCDEGVVREPVVQERVWYGDGAAGRYRAEAHAARHFRHGQAQCGLEPLPVLVDERHGSARAIQCLGGQVAYNVKHVVFGCVENAELVQRLETFVFVGCNGKGSRRGFTGHHLVWGWKGDGE
ncbi:hypothetical protein H257_00606 [Aphanomyces astaci]|uniref:Uncharacterized protein n=1 Tax=Aphanomyces astaci TaxID=112090 RepID=W4HD76_APHAT|nr:hypothetical protein H257_00606 [Aphanomyces astaci]ETV89259.1 hypothetical protein H257_00606 [Aphanomyces astaci]|eukprot:XP_009821659.1 hypothetical protein H257_00606 [Aphanomyces astaci]